MPPSWSLALEPFLAMISRVCMLCWASIHKYALGRVGHVSVYGRVVMRATLANVENASAWSWRHRLALLRAEMWEASAFRSICVCVHIVSEEPGQEARIAPSRAASRPRVDKATCFSWPSLENSLHRMLEAILWMRSGFLKPTDRHDTCSKSGRPILAGLLTWRVLGNRPEACTCRVDHCTSKLVTP